MATNKRTQQIKDVYHNVKKPASFGGYTSLARNLEEPVNVVKSALSESDVYTLNRDSRKRFPRRSVIVTHPHSQYGGDLLDLSQFMFQNGRYRYVLVISDMFTKEVWLEGIKKKTAKLTADAMETIIKRAKIPKGSKLQVDKGREFMSDFQVLLNKYEIKKIHTYTPIKVASVERLNRTIRKILRGLFMHNNNKKWMQHLYDIEKRLNSTVSTVTGFSPNKVKFNVDSAFHNIYKKHVLEAVKNKKKKILSNGTPVRISARRFDIFSKGGRPWSKEIFRIHGYRPSIPVGFYTLVDGEGHVLQSGYYAEEIQAIRPV